MRKIYYALLFFLFLAVIVSCSKTLQELEQSHSKIEMIKQDFYFKRLDTALMQLKTKTDKFKQDLAWDKAANLSTEGSTLYYIPIIWRNNVSKGVEPIEMNYKSFLIAKEKDNSFEFLTAKYFDKDSTNSFSKPTSEFTGKVIVQDYYGSANIASFESGVQRMSSDRKIMSTGIPGSIQICYDRYVCTYSGSCVNSGASGGAYITSTESNGGCMPPAPISCPFFQWALMNTASFPVCEDIPIPPMPPGGWTGTIPSPVQNAIQSIVKQGVTLGATTKRLLQEVLDDCLGKVVISRLSTNKKKLNFIEDSGQSTPAAYDPRTETVKADNSGVALPNMMEELIHAYQDVQYGGTTKYLDSGIPGAQNIEYEVKVLFDIRQSIFPANSNKIFRTGKFALGNNEEYLLWLEDITESGSQYPRDFSQIREKYFYFLHGFGEASPEYKTLKMDPNLEPKILFDLLKDADCF
ncbi:hypothetical protein RYH73_19740 [Olivibacter sp. CPCC 100613]|uniref:hypothetical protein n=1 Tax=Olivibacter sp. CPCC 100613 TaxID=3079931 RepID=UPI002FF89962